MYPNRFDWPTALLLCLLPAVVAPAKLAAQDPGAEQSRTDEAEPPFGELQLEPIGDGLTAPHYLTTPPADDRRFVLDLTGQIIILNDQGAPLAEPFLDLSDRMVDLNPSYDERGLLGLAFHPQYAQNGRFFVYYSAPLQDSAPSDWNHTSHLSEFRVSDDPNRADPDSERVMLRIDQPQMNHNGGRIVFGADGLLFVGLGDGGAAGDLGVGHPPLGNGQDVTTLLGSVLRINVEQQPYAIPDDNPLVGKTLPADKNYAGDTLRTEIWAWGVRNAWGMALDRKTGDLYYADVGQGLWEEVNQITKPGNYGWHLQEGTHGFDPQNMHRILPDGPETGALGEPLIDPVIEYKNQRGHPEGLGVCVVGGYIYRGQTIKPLQGQYVFGDWNQRPGEPSGVVLVARPTPKKSELWPIATAVEHDQYILGFGEDADGELYVLSSDQRGPTGDTGRIFRITAKR